MSKPLKQKLMFYRSADWKSKHLPQLSSSHCKWVEINKHWGAKTWFYGIFTPFPHLGALIYSRSGLSSSGLMLQSKHTTRGGNQGMGKYVIPSSFSTWRPCVLNHQCFLLPRLPQVNKWTVCIRTPSSLALHWCTLPSTPRVQGPSFCWQCFNNSFDRYPPNAAGSYQHVHFKTSVPSISSTGYAVA